MAEVKLDKLSKIYLDENKSEKVLAVKELSLTCHRGEFLVLLGPSGCGKTSTLRMIAGLEAISSGKIQINNKIVNNLLPKDRNIAMAFENYALYPPLTVRENLIYSLQARRMSKQLIEKKLTEVATVLDINNILDRFPGELSGGQQQRVSLGRCIIREADIYLMDEPLSHIDSELRLRTRTELKRIHEQYERTIVYVTHDQIEALALADRIAIMHDGVLQQIGTPEQVFDYPVNLFVATFIGEPPMNLIHGSIAAENNSTYFSLKDKNYHLSLPVGFGEMLKNWEGKDLILGVRPHHIHLISDNVVDKQHGSVVVYESLGEEGVLEMELEGSSVLVQTESDLSFHGGENVDFVIDWKKVIFFDKESERAIDLRTGKNHG
jgi:multiple sugar transport system ATP-binding protein